MRAVEVGKVYLVGAGPGDPELLTLKGKRCLETADVILYDELANRALLEFARGNAELVYVGKKAGAPCIGQREIEAALIREARRGGTVVRLKGGDPFVFGRGGEEALALRAAGIPFEIVPGISSATAVPAYAGIPVTHRALASSFAVVTGHQASAAGIRYGSLARSVDTLVILMGSHRLKEIMEQLLADGCDPSRPVGLIASGTSCAQKILVGTVGTIYALAGRRKFQSPVLIIVGQVVSLHEQLEWFAADLADARVPTERFPDNFVVPNFK